jgi:hypothetical protein
VAAASAGNAWAVGATGLGKTLIVHWNGRTWKQVPSPSPGTADALTGIAVTSAADAWAVGYTGTGGPGQTLIVHWNGRTWTRVPSPSPAVGSFLSDVSATSRRSAWAVGYNVLARSNDTRSLILHWDGRHWKKVSSPSPGTTAGLFGASAVSPDSAWAVGATYGNGRSAGLILRWNGRRWIRMTVPSLAEGGVLHDVAGAGGKAWAVGSTASGKVLIIRWNGTAWK